MSKLCPTCGMLSDDNSTVCSHCGTALPELVQNDNVVEAVTTPIEEIETLDLTEEQPQSPVVEQAPVIETVETPVQKVEISSFSEPVVETLPIVEQAPVVEVSTPAAEEVKVTEVPATVVEEVQVQAEEPSFSEPVVEALPKVEQPVEAVIPTPVETSTVEEVVPEPVQETIVEEAPNTEPVLNANTVIEVSNGIEEVSAENLINTDIESVSVQVVEEETPVEEVVQQVVLPEATVGEIDPSLLTSMYEEAEKKNEDNKAILAKQEAERIVREEAEKLEKQKMEPKPDLLARDYINDEDFSSSGKKNKKKKSFLPTFFIILILMLAVAGIYYFFFMKKETIKEDTYETPIEEYYAALNKKDKDKLLNTYVPCTRADENVNNEVAVSLAALNIYESLKIEYKITSTEVVNSVDQDSIKTTMLGTYCGLENIPEITNYKHIFVEQTLITDERTTNNVEFWVVQIEDKWYIVPITENI